MYTKYFVNYVYKPQLCRDRGGRNANIQPLCQTASQLQASASDGAQHDRHLLRKTAALQITSE